MENPDRHNVQHPRVRRALLLFQLVIFGVALWGVDVLAESFLGLARLVIEMVRSRSLLPNVFVLVFSAVGVFVGVLCLLVAYKSWFRLAARSARWVCMIAAFVVFEYLLGGAWFVNEKILSSWHVGRPPGPLLPGADPSLAVLEWLAILTVVVSYRAAVRWLSARLELVDERSHEQRLYSVKASLLLLAWALWLTASQIGDYVRPLPGSGNRPELLDGVAVLGPCVLAIAFYRIGGFFATRIARKARRAELNEAARQSAIRAAAMNPAEAQAVLPVLQYREPGCEEFEQGEIWPPPSEVNFDRGATLSARIGAALAASSLIWFTAVIWGQPGAFAVNIIVLLLVALFVLVAVGVLGKHKRKTKSRTPVADFFRL
jgi:hypothetical protein